MIERLTKLDIADLLFICKRTVQTHHKNLMEKLGVKT